ncbi:uncharacterized protein LOC108904662 [Anoplophora glabripennis]|uniref:uncharacterized protein LOC108904662 n=1 Tax=Anoplophora glabripennis TaxID=217634 RepID=UPI000873778B|nr:uncharacterized protein LOC108904662 [Anoplophora glabripennis]
MKSVSQTEAQAVKIRPKHRQRTETEVQSGKTKLKLGQGNSDMEAQTLIEAIAGKTEARTGKYWPKINSLEFALVLFDTLDRPTWFILSRLFFECYQVMFGLLFTIYFNFFCIIFIIGFIKIKNILNAIRDNAIEERSHSPIKLLLAASRMYEDIFYGIEGFNRMVSVPLLTMVVTNTFDSLVIITIIYNGEQNKMDYLHLGAIGMFYVMVILSAVAVTQLSEQLCDILGECNICYTDTEMSLAKNTFLLQLCHQKINFSICKMMPLTMDALVNIFTFGTTIVIFLFQLANTW